MKKKFHHQKNEINKRTNELFAYTNEVNVLPMSLVNRIFFFILISKEFCQQFQHLWNADFWRFFTHRFKAFLGI